MTTVRYSVSSSWVFSDSGNSGTKNRIGSEKCLGMEKAGSNNRFASALVALCPCTKQTAVELAVVKCKQARREDSDESIAL